MRSDRPRINYKALLEPKLPKLTASTGGRTSRKIDTQLYPVEVVETEGTRVAGRHSAQSRLRNAAVVVVLRSTG